MLGVSVSTLLRWEKAEKRPPPIRFQNRRNGERQYSDEWIKETRAWMEQLVQNPPPRNSLQGKRKKIQEKA